MRRKTRSQVRLERKLRGSNKVQEKLNDILQTATGDLQAGLNDQELFTERLYDYLLKCEAVLKQHNLFHIVKEYRPTIVVADYETEEVEIK